MVTRPDIKVILLTGPAGAGKSTACDLIRSMHIGQYGDFSFASPIKSMLEYGFDLDLDNYTGESKEAPKEEFGGRSFRYLAQTLGTDWGRQMIHPNIWAILAVNRVKEANSAYRLDHFIFDDCRFDNEIDLMREAFDTTVINILPQFDEYQPIEASSHASEQQELDYDVRIHNYGDLDYFKEQLEEALK